MAVNGFILAAGLGARFRPLTLTVPKALIPVLGKPSILYSLDKLQALGVKETVINTFHLSDELEKAVGSGEKWNMNIKFSKEPELLGSAGGVARGWDYFKHEDTTVILSSDVITDVDVSKVLEFHRRNSAEFTIAVIERDDVSGAGIVGFDSDSKITKYLEKPAPDKVFSHWVNGSIYIMEPSIIKYMPDPVSFFDFSHDLFPKLIEHNCALYAYPVDSVENYLVGIDSPDLRDIAEAVIQERK